MIALWSREGDANTVVQDVLQTAEPDTPPVPASQIPASSHMFPSFTTTAGPAARLTRHLFYRLRRLLHRRISRYASARAAHAPRTGIPLATGLSGALDESRRTSGTAPPLGTRTGK
ncbi:hypothetical protein [Streptomyces klenkii]|uniref:hypothetical protein n=1 Tax=Streptomyces klenkii TaxID=1420899 RepID=UPI0011C4580D|nr:hypothetical protein [Streptomyces klenkii]